MNSQARWSLLAVLLAVACDNPSEPEGEVLNIFLRGGDEQRGRVGEPLDDTLWVAVEKYIRADDRMVPQHNVEITWRVAEGGGTFHFARAFTDENGRAHAGWTLGMLEGQQRVTATALRGDGSTIGQRPFTAWADPLPPGLSWGAISAGGGHSCGLTVAGVAYCWGHNAYGQLGDGTTVDRRVPTAIGTDLRFVSISAGHHHTCAVAVDGLGYCWGTNNFGSLGVGTLESREGPGAVVGGHRFREIASGASHTCGLTTDDIAYCWGLNSSGALGGAAVGWSLEPVAVSGGHRFATITVGWSHSCAVDFDGVGYCWGVNLDGQLGNGTTASPVGPGRVEAGDLRFAMLSAGAQHTCGRLTTPRKVYCWGRNEFGQVGDGTAERRLTPAEIDHGAVFFVDVRAGTYHSCALGGPDLAHGDMKAYCWGRGPRIGDAGTSGRPKPTEVAGGRDFSFISTGYDHTCAVAFNDRVFCWGGNLFGGLGNGTTSRSLVPVAVSAPAN